MSSAPELAQDALITRAIERRLYQYARAVDRCDWDAVRDCYHPDAFDHHGAYQGGVDGLIADMKVRHALLDRSTHVVTNVLVSVVAPGVAMAESYCLCWLRERAVDAEGRKRSMEVRCRYLDRFTVGADGAWRIAARMVVFDEMKAEMVEDVTPVVAARSERDAVDPLWTFVERGADWDSRDYANS